jgi:hypothetical protein
LRKKNVKLGLSSSYFKFGPLTRAVLNFFYRTILNFELNFWEMIDMYYVYVVNYFQIFWQLLFLYPMHWLHHKNDAADAFQLTTVDICVTNMSMLLKYEMITSFCIVNSLTLLHRG